ncbi:hypothetical protein ACFSYG_06460 [Leeuwenhoekiella polynyae]|uniref:hypothetical protein n=1 Tax=Leeuwenhoekiella polynyae TaxID=1550906 RepID=UPI000FFEE4A7|nr:hypothetical protein [Leeuwenhoekiella polynyae]
MRNTPNRYLIIALLIGVVFHGFGIFFTLEGTYDALIHLFFADHYATHWFEPWNYSWYTGFTVMGYPPLVHQAIAVLSLIGGLKFGMFSVAIVGVILFITGVYRFALLITANPNSAGYAAILAVFSSSFVETLHIFGQLPSIIGVSILMHCLPEIYLWLLTGRKKYFLTSLSLLAVTICSHHVTPIFGMVFFIFPLIGMAVMDQARSQVASMKAITFRVFLTAFFKLLKRMIAFGFTALFLIITCILPYWVNTKNNPITQVPIPHGSRDNFLEITSSGLVFFLIPWGILLLLMPYFFYRYYSKRYLFFGLSLTMLTILGTGGTTPIPKMILGDNAFNILTLDRFTLWGSILVLPLFGEFAYRFAEGDYKTFLSTKLGGLYHRILAGFMAAVFLGTTVFTLTLSNFRPSQPTPIKMLPIVNFLNQDMHYKWRFLPLGFGDQIAWLSAQTDAMTVDGNYHSARRLPELTTRAIERLENSKFRGVEGIGSLQQFLTVPEKYNLKYVFSNDKFYDPILYFAGWQRLGLLENGIMVWEKLGVPPMPELMPKDDIPLFLILMWGIIPLSTVLVAFVINIQSIWLRALRSKKPKKPPYMQWKIDFSASAKTSQKRSQFLFNIAHFYGLIVVCCFAFGIYTFYLKNADQVSPKNVVEAYFDALDFKELERAYSYFDPQSDKSLDQFMLEFAVTDGLLNSYAKLDAIRVAITKETDSNALATAKASWITPLELINTTEDLELVKRSGKWYVKPKKPELDLPPDQLITITETDFYNHGRRRITSEQTYHEDILKQPVLEVLSARLLKVNNDYVIVGEIQNVDNVPADVSVKGTLYDEEDLELATYNAKYEMKHKLMPKEITSFKIEFEGTAWINPDEHIPLTFDPDQFTPIELDGKPVNFDLHVSGNVANTDLYKRVAINSIEVKDDQLTTTLFNPGTQQATIPQLLLSYYDDEHQLQWVSHHFLQEGVRQQRKQQVSIALNKQETQLISDSMQAIFVNGLPNTEIARKVIPQRDISQEDAVQIKLNGGGFLKVEINSYLGNPR